MSQSGLVDIIGTHPEIPTEFIANVGTAVPIANQLELLGEVVAAGSVPFESVGSGNTITYQIQLSQEIGATDVTKVGLAAFDSSGFDVDANGFVTLTGGGGATTNIDVDASTPPGTDPVVPNAGNIIMTGAQVASGVVGTNVIRTDSLAANTVTIEIQRSTSSAATDVTKNGVSHFDSSVFSVDPNGFVTTSGTGILNTLTGNSGGAISPTAGNINTVGTGSITIVGSGSTLTTQLTGLTNHALQIGAGTATLTQLGAGTTGQVLQTNTAADPTWSTATYPSTTTINQILYSSANNTVSEISTAIDGVLITSHTGVPSILANSATPGYVLTANSGAPPSWTANGSGDVVGPASSTDNALVRWDGTTGKLIQNGVTTEDDTGNISQTASVSGSSLSYTLSNTSNTASSTANHILSIGGSSAGDAYTSYVTPAVTTWTIGSDTSNFSSFSLSASATLGTNEIFSTNYATFVTTFGSGNLRMTRSASAATTQIFAGNSESTNAASHAAVNIQSTGASGGDPYLGLLISGVKGYSIGIDNSDSDKLKITDGSTFSSTDYLTMSITGAVSIVNDNFDVTRSASGSTVSATVANTSNTASSNALINAQVAGTSAADAYYKAEISGGQAWTWGLDNSNSDAFVLSNSSSLGTTNIMEVAVSTSLTEFVTGNLSVNRSSAGARIQILCANGNSANANSDAQLLARSNGSGGGDPYLGLLVNGGSGYSLGVDNSDSDVLLISSDENLAGTTFWRMTTAGERTMPLQPAFSAYLDSQVNNVTGTGTTFTLGTTTALTEIFDQNSDFNTNGTFTAPVTGRYNLYASVTLVGCTINTGGVLTIATSNRSYNTQIVRTATSNNLQFLRTVLADMDAADTCTVVVTGTGEAGDTDDVYGDGTGYTTFMGSLEC